MKNGVCLLLLALFPLQGFAAAPSSIARFFDRLEEADVDGAKMALLQAMLSEKPSPKHVRGLFQLFVDEFNQRYHCSFSPNQMLKMTMRHLALDSVGRQHLLHMRYLAAAMYQREGPIVVEEGDGPEAAVDMVVGVVECFAGALCYIIPHPFAHTFSAILLGDGVVRIGGAIPEQNELNRKWRIEHGLEP